MYVEFHPYIHMYVEAPHRAPYAHDLGSKIPMYCTHAVSIRSSFHPVQ